MSKIETLTDEQAEKLTKVGFERSLSKIVELHEFRGDYVPYLVYVELEHLKKRGY